MNEVVEFLYTGCSSSLPVLDGHDYKHERQLTDEDILDELALSLQDVDFDLLDTGEFYVGQSSVWDNPASRTTHHVGLPSNPKKDSY